MVESFKAKKGIYLGYFCQIHDLFKVLYYFNHCYYENTFFPCYFLLEITEKHIIFVIVYNLPKFLH